MKLYYWPKTRAFTSLWMLEELGQPYEIVLVDLSAPGHPTDAYRQINPMGKLPGFEDDGCAMGETAAILQYLADRFPEAKLAPALSNPQRGRFLQWLMFPATTMEPVITEKRLGLKPNTIHSGWGDHERAMTALDAALQPGPWLLGDQFTAADLYVASHLNFGMSIGMIDRRAAFTAMVERATTRPAYKRAAAIEGHEVGKAYPSSAWKRPMR